MLNRRLLISALVLAAIAATPHSSANAQAPLWPYYPPHYGGLITCRSTTVHTGPTTTTGTMVTTATVTIMGVIAIIGTVAITGTVTTGMITTADPTTARQAHA